MIDPVSSATSPIASNSAVSRTDAGALRIANVGPSQTVQSPDFAAVLARAALSAIDTLKGGEAAAITGMQGKASVQQVAEAVMSAEQTLQSAIAVRDKVVAAYLELSRMQI
jgi:flagellar hook-basal body complex protein FliE